MQLALDLLALLDGQRVLEVKHGLLPVRVLGVGPRGEAHGLVAGRELNVEPGDERVHKVVALAPQRKVGAKCQILGLARVKVECQDGGWVGDDGLELDGVDERLREGRLLERRVVKAIDVIPD